MAYPGFSENSSLCEANVYVDLDSDGQEEVAAIHLIASSISAACCLTVLVVSWAVEPLRRFPRTLLLWKTASDLITAVSIIAINGSITVGVAESGNETAISTIGTELCSSHFLASLLGFSLFASPSWFFALAYNLNRSLHDPFTRPQARLLKLHAFVWSCSLAIGAVVGIFSEYRANLHLCWSCHGTSDLFSWLFLFGWIVGYWVVSLIILLDAWYRLVHTRRSGSLLTERLASRVPQLRESAIYVFIMGAHWTGTAITFVVMFEPTALDNAPLMLSPLPWRIVFAVMLGLLGPVDATCWLVTALPTLRDLYWQHRLNKLASESDAAPEPAQTEAPTANSKVPLWHGNQRREKSASRRKAKKKRAKEQEMGDISDLLRREFVQCTVAGIEASLRRTLELRVEEDIGARHASLGLGPTAELEMQERGVAALVGGAAGSVSSHRSCLSSGSTSARVRSSSSPLTAVPPGLSLPDERFAEVQQLQLAPAIFFSELAPRVFEKLRADVFNTPNPDYISSIWGDVRSDGEEEGRPPITTSQEVVDRMLLSFSEGKGGGFFFWSLDRRFLVKTLENEEYAAFSKLLPAYYAHLCTRPGSLLPRFFGTYSITIQNHTKHFVVMESIFFTAPQGKVHERYDLKGSWVDRHAGMFDAASGTYKDMDLHKPLRLDRSAAEALIEELKHDSELLANSNIMDYSLLLGVHNVPVPVQQLGLNRETGDVYAQTVDVPRYYLGVIDVLQKWNWNKRLERWSKTLLKGRFAKGVRDGMSAIEPVTYRNRFLAGMSYQLGLESYTSDTHSV